MANLFKSDYDILREFIAANVTNVWNTIAPYIDEAESKVIQTVVGQEMWDKLQTDVDADSNDADHLALLKHVRRAQANFAYLLYAADGAIEISDTGILQVEEGGKKGAYQWQVRAFKKARSERGWEALHQALKLLISKRDVYTQWSESDKLAEIMSVLLPTLEDFNKQRRIDGFETLWSLRPAMLYVQEKIIATNLGQALYEEITEGFLDDDMSADNKVLFNTYIAPAIAHLSVARSAEELTYTMGPNGLRLSGIKAVSDNSYEEKNAGRSEVFSIQQDAKAKGDSIIRDMRQFLNKNASATKYPSYFNDTNLYVKDEEHPKFTQNNGGTYWAS